MEDYESKAIRVWMRNVMENRQWSANKWATMAGTSPTNITRFLNGGKFLPSSKTLGKLAYIAGSAPQLSQNALTDATTRTISLLDSKGNKAGTMTVFNIKGTVRAYRVDFDCPTHGIMPNDIIIVRAEKKFEAGNLVAYFDKGVMGVGTKIEGQNSLFRNKSAAQFIRMGEIDVIGRVVQIIKELDD
jgi:hypothetical protein